MAPMTDQQKIGFLLVALRHSGKTNWAGVGAELGLQTGTASKRLVYITQAAGKFGGGGEGESSAMITPKKIKKGIAVPTPKKGSARKSSPKKQKLLSGAAMDLDGEEDVDLNFSPIHQMDRKRRASSQKVSTYKEETDTEVETGVGENGGGNNGGVKAEDIEDGEHDEVETFVDAAESHCEVEIELEEEF